MTQDVLLLFTKCVRVHTLPATQVQWARGSRYQLQRVAMHASRCCNKSCGP
jgi:hypothetical protein